MSVAEMTPTEERLYRERFTLAKYDVTPSESALWEFLGSYHGCRQGGGEDHGVPCEACDDLCPGGALCPCARPADLVSAIEAAAFDLALGFAREESDHVTNALQWIGRGDVVSNRLAWEAEQDAQEDDDENDEEFDDEDEDDDGDDA